MYIQKRDGKLEKFNSEKIVKAVLAAFQEVEGDISEYALNKSKSISEYVEGYAETADHVLDISEIQTLVENGLMNIKNKDVARAYILYREERDRYRGSLTDTTMLDYLQGNNEYWKNENSNKDAAVVTTQRDYIAGIASTDIARRKLLPREVCEAHDAGIIHQHK